MTFMSNIDFSEKATLKIYAHKLKHGFVTKQEAVNDMIEKFGVEHGKS